MRQRYTSKKELIETILKKNRIIKRIKSQKDKLMYYATRDYMTNTLNKRSGMKYLEKYLNECDYYNRKLTLTFVDVDGLKKINDKFGHIEGDKLLVEVSNILRNSIRKKDLVFRAGGDEFVLVFPNTSLIESKNIWKRISKKIIKLNSRIDLSYKISLSYGLAEYSAGSNISTIQLIKMADKDMYKRKRNILIKNRRILSKNV